MYQGPELPTSSIPNRGLGFARLIAGCWFCPAEGTPNCKSGVSEVGGEGEGRIVENSVCVRARYSEMVTSSSASTVSSDTYKKLVKRDPKFNKGNTNQWPRLASQHCGDIKPWLSVKIWYLSKKHYVIGVQLPIVDLGIVVCPLRDEGP